jgi:hypothetical protein
VSFTVSATTITARISSSTGPHGCPTLHRVRDRVFGGVIESACQPEDLVVF